MSKLEDFVKNNREDFDKFEPGPVVWHNIQQELNKPAEKKGILISMRVLKRSAAAAILLMIGTGVYYAVSNKKTDQTVASTDQKKTTPSTLAPHDSIKETPADQENTAPENDPELAVNDNTENEELIHYTRLIEIKQQQIMKIKNDEPLLYKQFAGDFNKLDSTFHILKKKLPVNPNREQILEAMIQNLQYQEALLNQQLNIIKKINNTKKEAYEKAYKSA